MSVPKNHHYVSQCQIKKFFNKEEGKVYVYNKETKRIQYRRSSEKLYSEDESNSRFINNKIDHQTLEDDLNKHFEHDFNKHFQMLEEAINIKSFTPEFKDAVSFFTKYGIAGYIRPPSKKSELDNKLKSSLLKVYGETSNEGKHILDLFSQTKHSNKIIYSEFSEKVYSAMGDVNAVLYSIVSDDFFLLPDLPSITKREKINEYFNPDVKEIAMVGIPLSSKIFLNAESSKYRKYNDRISYLSAKRTSVINRINYSLYLHAHKEVACENKKYLENFIQNISVFESTIEF